MESDEEKEMAAPNADSPGSGDRLLDDPEYSDIKAVTSGDTVYTSAVAFEDLKLSHEIQALTVPMIITPPYKDLVAQAHNGSGKTTCFVLGMLSRVDPTRKVPQAICICPTRELAQQNHAVLLKMGKYTGITSMCAIPSDSANYIPIIKRPSVTEQVIIGTPGTIKKFTSAKKLSTRDIKILVFDEADHMLADVLLFSATFDEIVHVFVSKVIKEGNNQIFVKLTLEKVKQYKVRCPDEPTSRVHVIKEKILEFGQLVGQTIIFVRTRDNARKLHE